MKILLTGGGTAGHIFPLIALVREIKRLDIGKDIQFVYLGPKDDFAKSFFSQEGIAVKTILAGKIRRYFSFRNVLDMLKVPVGMMQAFFTIFIFSPDIIFSKGGYGSLPVVISGWLLLTPIFLHESDAAPGLANKIAGKLALEIFTAFPVEKTEYFPAKKMISVGNPIRAGILKGSTAVAKKHFSLTGKKPVVLILGGSQGAQRINNVVLIILSDFLKQFEVIHQTGKRNFEAIKNEASTVIKKEQQKEYHPVPFLDETALSHAYKVADLIVSRAGAGTIFEIAAAKKPSIIVPLRGSAQNHQVKNAYAYAENGAAEVLEDANFTPHFFLERVKYLFSQKGRLPLMARKAGEFAKPDAARIIAKYLLAYLE